MVLRPGSLANLTLVDCSENSIRRLPREFTALGQLTKLVASDNLLSRVPSSIGNMTQLVELHLVNPCCAVVGRVRLTHSRSRLPTPRQNENHIRDLPKSFTSVSGQPSLGLPCCSCCNNNPASNTHTHILSTARCTTSPHNGEEQAIKHLTVPAKALQPAPL